MEPLALLYLLAAETTPVDIGAELLKFGIAGVFLLAIILGYLVPRSTTAALHAQIAMLSLQLQARDVQLAAMISNYEHEVIPTLSRVNSDLGPALRGTADQLTKNGAEIVELRRQVQRLADRFPGSG